MISTIIILKCTDRSFKTDQEILMILLRHNEITEKRDDISDFVRPMYLNVNCQLLGQSQCPLNLKNVY